MTEDNASPREVQSHLDSAQDACPPRQRGYVLCFAFMLFAVMLLLLQPSIRGNDGVQNYSYLRSALFDRDLDFSNDYGYYYERHSRWFDERAIPRDPVTGRPINLYGVGSSLLWLPFVGAYHGLASVATALGVEWSTDGFGRGYEWAVSVGTCFYASSGLILLLVTLARFVPFFCTLAAVATVWLSTPLFFYMYFHPSMSHGNSFFLASLLLFLATGRDTRWRWACMGFVASLLVLTRFQDAVLVSCVLVLEVCRFLGSRASHSPPGAWLPHKAWTFIRQRSGNYALAVACALPLLALQMAAWNVLQGSPWSGPRAYLSQGGFAWYAPPHLVEVLFSAHHGLLAWHPVLIFALVGLALGRAPRAVMVACLAAFGAQWWLVGGWSHWSAGASFGHRMFVSTLPFLAVGFAVILSAARVGVPRGIAAVVFALAVYWNMGLIVQYGTEMIPRQSPVPLSTLAYNNFVRVPGAVLERLVP